MYAKACGGQRQPQVSAIPSILFETGSLVVPLLYTLGEQVNEHLGTLLSLTPISPRTLGFQVCYQVALCGVLRI